MSDLRSIKLEIWTHRKVHKNPIDLQIAADASQVRLPITQVHEAEKLLEWLNKPHRVKRTVITPPWCIDRYMQAHKDNFKQEYPQAFAGGFYAGMEPTVPDLATTNGITTFVSNYVKWVGGYANRINVAGRIIKNKQGNEVRIKSSTKRGTEDLDILWRGRKIACEIKNAITKDTVKPDQDKQKGRIERAGGIYIIVTGVENFFVQWDKIVSSIPIQATLL